MNRWSIVRGVPRGHWLGWGALLPLLFFANSELAQRFLPDWAFFFVLVPLIGLLPLVLAVRMFRWLRVNRENHGAGTAR
jgi:hypothetical protein